METNIPFLIRLATITNKIGGKQASHIMVGIQADCWEFLLEKNLVMWTKLQMHSTYDSVSNFTSRNLPQR